MVVEKSSLSATAAGGHLWEYKVAVRLISVAHMGSGFILQLQYCNLANLIELVANQECGTPWSTCANPVVEWLSLLVSHPKKANY